MTAQPSPPPDAVRLHSVRRRLNVATVVITFGALAFGYDTGVISGALPFMTRSTAEGGLGLTPTTSGMVTSSLLLGAAFGAIIGGRLSDRHGRRHNVMMLAFVFFLGALGCALAPNLPIMLVCRMILGFAVGGASATVPMFIGELAPAERRGPLVSRNELMIVTGQLIAYVSNAIIGLVSEGGHAWRLMLGLATIPAAALWIGVHFVPESPRWLVSRGRSAEALEVLTLLRTGDPRPEVEEIAEIVKETAEAQSNAREHLGTPWIRRITLIGIGFGIVIQLTGVNAIMYFAPTVLMSTGMGTQASLVATIANGVVSVVAVAIGIGLLKRLPRKRMMIIGQTGVVVSLVMLGFMFLLPASVTRSYLVLLFMLTFLFSMQCFTGPTFWLMLAEMFPMRVRGLANGVAVFCNWMGNVIVAFAFPNLIAAVQGNTFFVFAVINALTLAFYARFLPETFGHTLESLERHFEERYS